LTANEAMELLIGCDALYHALQAAHLLAPTTAQLEQLIAGLPRQERRGIGMWLRAYRGETTWDAWRKFSEEDRRETQTWTNNRQIILRNGSER